MTALLGALCGWPWDTCFGLSQFRGESCVTWPSPPKALLRHRRQPIVIIIAVALSVRKPPASGNLNHSFSNVSESTLQSSLSTRSHCTIHTHVAPSTTTNTLATWRSPMPHAHTCRLLYELMTSQFSLAFKQPPYIRHSES